MHAQAKANIADISLSFGVQKQANIATYIAISIQEPMDECAGDCDAVDVRELPDGDERQIFAEGRSSTIGVTNREQRVGDGTAAGDRPQAAAEHEEGNSSDEAQVDERADGDDAVDGRKPTHGDERQILDDGGSSATGVTDSAQHEGDYMVAGDRPHVAADVLTDILGGLEDAEDGVPTESRGQHVSWAPDDVSEIRTVLGGREEGRDRVTTAGKRMILQFSMVWHATTRRGR